MCIWWVWGMASEMCVHVYVGINQKPHTTLTHTQKHPQHTRTPPHTWTMGPLRRKSWRKALTSSAKARTSRTRLRLKPGCRVVCVVGLCLRGALIGVVVDGSNSTCSFMIHVLRGVPYLAVAEFVGAGLRLLEKPLPGAA